MTCIYGPAVINAFPDPLITVYRHLVLHVSWISILDGTALNWCKREHLRNQMSETVLFGKVKDHELMVLKFSGELKKTGWVEKEKDQSRLTRSFGT